MLVLALFCLVCSSAQATLLQDVMCDTNVTLGFQDNTDNEAVVLFDASQVSVNFRLLSTEFRQSIYLDLKVESLVVSAENAAGEAVGTALNWTTVQPAVKTKPGQYPGCITTPGCDGLILDTVTLIRMFPPTAVTYVITGKKAQWSKNSTTVLSVPATTQRRLLANAPSGVEIIGESLPITTKLKFAQPWREAAFAPSDVDTDFKTVIGSVAGIVGFFMLLAVLYMIFRQPKDGEGKSSSSVNGGYYGRYSNSQPRTSRY